MRSYLMLASLAVLAGCTTLGDSKSDLVLPETMRPSDWKAGELSDVPPTGDWIADFRDNTLSALVSEALTHNPELAASAARVEAARATLKSQYGSALPSLSAGGTASWTSSVADVNDKAVRSEGASYGLSLNASWEPDFWGRISSALGAVKSDLAASEEDYQAAKLSLAGSTATAWIQLNSAVRQEALAKETLRVREHTKTLTERRFANGLSSALDVRLARSAIETAQASLASAERASGEARRAVEVLVGRYPANELEASDTAFELGPLTSAGDPTSLLARRPDIRAAEIRIASAGFRVDVARLAMRPSLSLTGSLSTSNTDIEDIFDPAFIAGRVLASLTAPLYQGGTLKANIEVQEAQARLSSANYVAAVLQAWREVENAIAADGLLAVQVESQTRALEEARLAENLAERQYQNGVATIFNLIDAQTRRINAESGLISAQSARALNRVQFHLALGGDLPGAETSSGSLSEGTNL